MRSFPAVGAGFLLGMLGVATSLGAYHLAAHILGQGNATFAFILGGGVFLAWLMYRLSRGEVG